MAVETATLTEVGSLLVSEPATEDSDPRIQKLTEEMEYRREAGFTAQGGRLECELHLARAMLKARDLGYKKIVDPLGLNEYDHVCSTWQCEVNHPVSFWTQQNRRGFLGRWRSPRRRSYRGVEVRCYRQPCPAHIVESFKVAKAQDLFARIYVVEESQGGPDPYLVGKVQLHEDRECPFDLYLIDHWDEEKLI